MAASMALPPALSTSTAIWVASGWLVAAMPFLASTAERVAKEQPVTRSWTGAGLGAGATNAASRAAVSMGGAFF
jgi:hypothetical protein